MSVDPLEHPGRVNPEPFAAPLDRVAREASAHHATKVRRLWLRIGEVSGVEVDLLRTAYEMCRERTICEGAALEVRQAADFVSKLNGGHGAARDFVERVLKAQGRWQLALDAMRNA